MPSRAALEEVSSPVTTISYSGKPISCIFTWAGSLFASPSPPGSVILSIDLDGVMLKYDRFSCNEYGLSKRLHLHRPVHLALL